MLHSVDWTFQVGKTFAEIPASDWDALNIDNPFLSHAFLSALEDAGCVGDGTGWVPHHLLAVRGGQLVCGMPLYLKLDSYGEYVFDWGWAEAYQRNGLEYYPKLLCAVPFTPVTGPRILSTDPEFSPRMVRALAGLLMQYELSSAHVNFPDAESAALFETAGWLKRSGVQFRWENKGYADFEEFLNQLTHNKRKRIHQERKKVAEAGVRCRWITGADVTEADWDFFYRCYCNTYRQHHSMPYLTRAFFSRIGQSMPQHILLIVAEIDGQPIASTLNIYNQHTLYGRYWGATQFFSGLHFELAYYQAQQFCIANGIRYFEGGAQGEHKLARGFEPRPTCSFHKIAHPQFAEAIAQAVRREALGVAAYTDELEERAPFKSPEN
ncbi:MAG TPA: GNAT family N-acetyltransferase [Methylophilus sp.]|nr:GNAT family N-acetyltransferase [Methylophilus sp.]HQQ33277.1 GNAT family N-acetyltransferase [Methylophilus sp.]